MKPIENLVPGSKIIGYIINVAHDKPVKRTFEVLESGKLRYHSDTNVGIAVVSETAEIDLRVSQETTWAEVGETPRTAIEAYIAKHRREIDGLQQSINRLTTLMKREYPKYPVLSPEQWAETYPYLHQSFRLEDHNPEELQRENDRVRAEDERYDVY